MDLLELKSIQHQQVKRHPWELCRVKILQFFIRSYNKNSILDIGSGDAFLASSLSAAYKHSMVKAVDINYTLDLVEHLKKFSPKNLSFHKDIKSAKAVLNRDVDIVILFDVLEHVADPGDLLQNICQSQINKNTLFIITVPAFQFLYSEHDRSLGHIKRYTLKSLSQLLHENQFEISRKGYLFNILMPIRWVQLSMEKISDIATTRKGGINNWKGNAIWTKLLTTYFWLEFKISWYLSRFGIQIPGLTCYCICRYSPS